MICRILKDIQGSKGLEYYTILLQYFAFIFIYTFEAAHIAQR